MEEEHPSPKSLRTLASAVEYPGRNSLLHQLVIDNSDTNVSQNGSYIKLILFSMSGVDVNAVNDEGCTALHLAVMKRNLPMVRILLSSLPDIDVNKGIQMPNSNYLQTALHLAVKSRHLPMIQELLEKGADVNIKDKYDITPLRRAAMQSRVDIVRFFVDTARDVNEEKLLLFAAGTGSVETVQFLVNEKGADINFRCEWGYTPLYLAVEKGHLSTVQFLLSRGADICAGYPLRSSDLHVLRFLLERGVDVDLNQSFLDAALYDKIETVQFLVEEKGIDINVEDKRGYNALHRTVGCRNANLTLWLLEKGADVNRFDKRGNTPLHFAEECGPTEIAFLERCAERNARDRRESGTP